MGERSAISRDRHEETVALLVDADSDGRGDVGLDLIGSLAAGRTVLKRSQAVPMNRRVHISRVGIETLTNHQASFAVRLFSGVRPANVGRKSDISRHAFPDEMKRILLSPHILAAAADEIGFPFCIVFDGAYLGGLANVAMRFEKTNRR